MANTKGMQKVDPIKEPRHIDEIRSALSRNKQSKRDIFFFNIGMLIPARISDLLELKVKDVRGVSHVVIHEQKTGKTNKFYINKQATKLIAEYTQDMDDEDYLFPSRQGNKPISRMQANRILNTAVKDCNLDINIGCHSLRKTFGHKFYHSNPAENLVKLQKIFNHSSQAVTLRYIGVEQEDIDASMDDLEF